MATKSVADMTVILVGNNFKLRKSVETLFLLKGHGQTAKHQTQTFRTKKGAMKDQALTVVTTPDLQNTNRADFTRYMKPLRSPLVFLLVLQPEGFTDKVKDTLQLLLESFSEDVFDHCLLLISTEQAEKPGTTKKSMNDVPYVWNEDPRIQKMITKCQGRYLCIKNIDKEFKEKLFTTITQIVTGTTESKTDETSLETDTERTGLHQDEDSSAQPVLHQA